MVQLLLHPQCFSHCQKIGLFIGRIKSVSSDFSVFHLNMYQGKTVRRKVEKCNVVDE